jgi:hypothetical protein
MATQAKLKTETAPFTPGPWLVNPIDAQVDCIEMSKKGGLLPVCKLLWPTDERSESETEANAHLISAAPSLYEAAERCIDLLRTARDQCGDNNRTERGNYVGYNAALEIVSATFAVALAKARGDA